MRFAIIALPDRVIRRLRDLLARDIVILAPAEATGLAIATILAGKQGVIRLRGELVPGQVSAGTMVSVTAGIVAEQTVPILAARIFVRRSVAVGIRLTPVGAKTVVA